MSGDAVSPGGGSGLIYRKSTKHCEPITAQRPGTKCPHWSETRAQEMLDSSDVMGARRVNTLNGLAFIAVKTLGNEWHGYPESWDKIDQSIRDRWLAERRIRQRDLRRWWTDSDIRTAWKEVDDAE